MDYLDSRPRCEILFVGCFDCRNVENVPWILTAFNDLQPSHRRNSILFIYVGDQTITLVLQPFDILGILKPPYTCNSTSMAARDQQLDEEFRRAQEMALAVAALAPKSPAGGKRRRRRRRRNQQQSAQDIRMAVADVICANPTGRINPNLDLPTLKHKSNSKRSFDKKNRASRNEDEEPKDVNVLQHLFGNLVEEKLANNGYYQELEGKILQGWDLISVLLMIHLVIFYLAFFPSASPVNNFINTAFVVNMAVVYCLTSKGKTVKFVQSVNTIDAESADKAVAEGFSKQADADLKSTSDDSAGSSEEEPQQLLPIETHSKIRLEWLEDVTFAEKDLEELEELQPESTRSECRRFLKARKQCVKAASAQLGQYLEWRETNRIDQFFPSTFTTDEDDWVSAARGAMEISNTSGKHVVHHGKMLPRVISVFEDDQTDIVVCKNGARIVHVLPGQLDSSLASNSTYALAVAMYLDRKLDRSCTEKVTVVIDIRSGLGWTNPSSVSIVPFIKLVVGLLNTYFPERLSRCILYPLPYTATLLFNKAKDYLDPDTAAKIQVCSGAGSTASPVPEKAFEFIGKEAMDHMEERRRSFFKE